MQAYGVGTVPRVFVQSIFTYRSAVGQVRQAARAEKVRQSLAASGNQHFKVLPVIVTTKTREEVRAESEQAYKLGVLVVTREVFGELITRSLLFPDANRLYAQAKETLRRLQDPSPFDVKK